MTITCAYPIKLLDGHLDIVDMNFKNSDASIRYGKGNGEFNGPSELELPGKGDVGGFVLGDFTGDGFPDILFNSRWLTAVAAFAFIASYQGLWHRFYWDIKVAPPHNIPEWNVRKILFAHGPNLVVTLAH